MKKKKILIDTDIGNDIDDAIAVCTALQSEELEVLAITTVYCATDKRAKMVKALLNSCNRGHIPVYAGSKYPLPCHIVFLHKVDICFQHKQEYAPYCMSLIRL